MSKEKIRYYKRFDEDFEKSPCQDYRLDDSYEWIRSDTFSRFLSSVIYAVAVAVSFLWCKAVLHMKIHGRSKLKGMKNGFFIYANHTQPVGDVFIPAHAVFPRRIYTVVSTANYGLPVIGRILPYLGALPVVENLHGLKELSKAIGIRISDGHPIVIYPEAHVWEYYTGIRPFPDTSFKYPVKFDAPSYVMTVTYKKSKVFLRPIMDVYLDGPFYGDGESARDKAANLHGKVYSCMKERAQASDFEYIRYIKVEE